MRFWIDVNKVKGAGASDFFQDLPMLMKSATTWKLEKHGPLSATIRSTATMTSIPEPPVYELSESPSGAGSVAIALANGKDWTHDQKAHALGPLVYLCLTAFASRVAKINIENY